MLKLNIDPPFCALTERFVDLVIDLFKPKARAARLKQSLHYRLLFMVDANIIHSPASMVTTKAVY